MCGVAACRIQQDGFVGKPPITIARTTHASQRRFSVALRQGKLQAGIDQRRGFARSRCADKDIPGQLIHVLTRQQGAQAAAHMRTKANPLEQFDGLIKLALQRMRRSRIARCCRLLCRAA